MTIKSTGKKLTKVSQEVYPTQVCGGCGIVANYLTCLKKYGRPPLKKAFDVSTFHKGKCDICKQKIDVTEARDFFYPDFSLIQQYIKEHYKKINSNTVVNISKVSRVEVIDHSKGGNGRDYVKWRRGIKVELSLQDKMKTLKVFIKDKK